MRKKNLFKKGIKVKIFLLFTIIYPKIIMFLRQFCLSNNLQTHIRGNADFLLQKPQQLPSAEANFGGCMIDCYQDHGLLSSTHVLITQSHSCIRSVWTILYGCYTMFWTPLQEFHSKQSCCWMLLIKLCILDIEWYHSIGSLVLICNYICNCRHFFCFHFC